MDDRIHFYFDQGLTQTEIALCLSVIDDLHISVRHLRRRLSGLQLYIRQYSNPERVVTCSQIQFPRGRPLSLNAEIKSIFAAGY